MRVLGDYNLFGRILMQKAGRGNNLTSDDFQTALINYEKQCEARKNQKSTFKRRAWILHHIIEHFIKCGATTCKEINPMHISSYVQSLLGYSKNAVESRLSTLRGFLHSMYLYGLRDDDLSLYVPKLYYPKSAKIPTTLTPEELSKIFAVIDRGSPIGKRDYCLILLVLRCGLRACDASNLQLNNINWECGHIEFTQEKTAVKVQLPIPEDVGIAIIDYLKYARPQTNTPYLFVKLIPPYDKLVYPSNIFNKYLARANIKHGQHAPLGMHTLRHTLATRLLEKDVPVEVISAILGHTKVESVKPYLQINIEKLKECALNEMCVSGGVVNE